MGCDASRDKFSIDCVNRTMLNIIRESAMKCDVSRDKNSIECIARNILDAAGNPDMDLFPMPEAATFCFLKEFHWPYTPLERQARRALRSPLRRDPVASVLIGTHLADAAEHAYIHNSEYLRDDVPQLIPFLRDIIRVDPHNARARFLLALSILQKEDHHPEADRQLNAVESILKKRERTRGLDDAEMYMLVEVYSKTGRRAEADAYLEKLEGAGRLSDY